MSIPDMNWVLAYPNVIGYSRRQQSKIVKGKAIPEVCIRVYVSKKLPLSELDVKDVIPAEVRGWPTDVVEIGVVKALNLLPFPKSRFWSRGTGRTIKMRPAIAGISVGHPCITAGTLGQPALKDGAKGWLSNWHIFKYDCGFLLDHVVQPGKYDGGSTPGDDLLQVTDAQDVIPEGQGINHFDAAFGKVLVPAEWTQDIARHNINERFQAQGETEIVQGDKCFFTGRTTEYGEGYCTDDAATVRVQYGSFIALFEDQLLFEFYPNIQGGNSGSPCYKMPGDLFGSELYAGSEYIAVGCKWIPWIKNAYKLTIPTGAPPPPPEGEFEYSLDEGVTWTRAKAMRIRGVTGVTPTVKIKVRIDQQDVGSGEKVEAELAEET